MDLTLSADQRDLQSGLREVLAHLWSDERLRTASSGTPAGLAEWRQLAGLGVFGVLTDESSGGMGLGLADAAVIFEELGAALVPGPLVPSVLMAGQVPGVVEGDALVAVLDLRCPVRVVEHLGLATHVVLVGHDGVALATPDELGAAPIETPLDPITPVWLLPSDRELSGAGSRIGDASDAAEWTRRAAVLTAALQVGVARGALDRAVRYAQERIQFDRVIGSFQAVKHLLAESLVRVDLARAAVLVAALAVEDTDVIEGTGSSERDQDVAAAKLLADDAATLNGRCGIQVHGGMGFTWEVLAHLSLKRAWVHETAFGTADQYAERLAAGI